MSGKIERGSHSELKNVPVPLSRVITVPANANRVPGEGSGKNFRQIDDLSCEINCPSPEKYDHLVVREDSNLDSGGTRTESGARHFYDPRQKVIVDDSEGALSGTNAGGLVGEVKTIGQIENEEKTLRGAEQSALRNVNKMMNEGGEGGNLISGVIGKQNGENLKQMRSQKADENGAGEGGGDGEMREA